MILVGDIANLDKKVQDWSIELDQSGQLSLADKLSVTNPLGFMGPALAFDKHIVINMNDISNALDQSQSVLYVEYKDSDNFEFKKMKISCRRL